MIAQLILGSGSPHDAIILSVETSPHPVAGNLQITTLRLDNPGNRMVWPMSQAERKALIAFLQSVPDDEP